MANNKPRPKLVVFDLDYTLWPFWVDTHVDPPFNKKSDGQVYDCRGKKVKCFLDSTKVLARLKSEGYKVAAASRTSEIVGAKSLVKLFGWEQYFDYKEIYPGTKTKHFQKFKEYSDIPYTEMLFFDDEYRNIQDLSKFGVTCIHVDESVGVTMNVLEEGFKAFEEQNNKSSR